MTKIKTYKVKEISNTNQEVYLKEDVIDWINKIKEGLNGDYALIMFESDYIKYYSVVKFDEFACEPGNRILLDHDSQDFLRDLKSYLEVEDMCKEIIENRPDILEYSDDPEQDYRSLISIIKKLN